MQKVSLARFTEISIFQDELEKPKETNYSQSDFNILLHLTTNSVIHNLIAASLNTKLSELLSIHYLTILEPQKPKDLKKVYDFLQRLADFFNSTGYYDCNFDPEKDIAFRQNLVKHLETEYNTIYA